MEVSKMSIAAIAPNNTLPTPDGWTGNKRHLWHTEQELKRLVLADLKAAGIRATVRFGRGGYSTRMTVTISISRSTIADAEQTEFLTSPGVCMTDCGYREALTPEGYAIYQKAKAIVTAYNRDESDIMTDYFDRDIYDHYYFKLTD